MSTSTLTKKAEMSWEMMKTVLALLLLLFVAWVLISALSDVASPFTIGKDVFSKLTGTGQTAQQLSPPSPQQIETTEKEKALKKDITIEVKNAPDGKGYELRKVDVSSWELRRTRWYWWDKNTYGPSSLPDVLQHTEGEIVVNNILYHKVGKGCNGKWCQRQNDGTDAEITAAAVAERIITSYYDRENTEQPKEENKETITLPSSGPTRLP